MDKLAAGLLEVVGDECAHLLLGGLLIGLSHHPLKVGLDLVRVTAHAHVDEVFGVVV